MIKKYDIKELKSGELSFKDDNVAMEIPFNIYVNQEHIVTLMCSPFNLEELALGFLFQEGIITKYSDVKSIREINDYDLCFSVKYYDRDEGPKVIVSGCGKGSIHLNEKFLNPELNKEPYVFLKEEISFEEIFAVVEEFKNTSKVFDATGGVHNVGLFKSGKILVSFEDIGRHNALDKIVGYILKNNINVKGYGLLLTGRISSDLVVKCENIGIKTIVSRSAPTSLGIDLGRQYKIKLIGFLRGKKMNIYS